MTTLKKSISILILLGLVAAFSTAMATEVRVSTMGGVGFYIHDNSNIFYFPGTIYSYSGQVYGEFRVKSSPNSYTIGVNYPVGDYSVVGAYLNRPVPITAPTLNPNGNRVILNQTTDLFYGTQMTNFDFGVKLSIGLDDFKQDYAGPPASTAKESARYLALGAGLSSEKMDVGAMVEMPSAKYDTTGLTNKWSGVGFAALGRLFYGEGNTKLVPLIVFNYRSTNTKIGTPEVKTDFTDLNFGLGAGLNHQLSENNLLVMAVELFGLQSSKEKPPAPANKITDSRTTLPGLYMGLESKIKSWLIGRLGAAQVWQETKHKVESQAAPPAATTETSTRASQYNVTFGLGINFGDFTADAAINEGLFFDGPNFIDGTTNPLASRLAVVYKF
jgi:hypothetical protein